MGFLSFFFDRFLTDGRTFLSLSLSLKSLSTIINPGLWYSTTFELYYCSLKRKNPREKEQKSSGKADLVLHFPPWL